MKILINASNLRAGGGLQVADSICRELDRHKEHRFVAVLCEQLRKTGEDIKKYDNVEVVEYQCPINPRIVLLGRDKFLDSLVEKKGVEAVMTVFGPSRWIPRVPHLSGMAIPHIVLPDSPYFKLAGSRSLYSDFRFKMIKWSFGRCSDALFTENEFISERLRKLFKKKKIYTVTNNYNQVFDEPERWERSIDLPPFEGLTLLTIASPISHKNHKIVIPTIEYISRKYPDLKYRFVFTITPDSLGEIGEEQRKHILFLGKVGIEQCPHLYEQADVMLLPSLLECFSASYAEAMRMRVPILTTDLGFAHSLCGDAALYYSATDPVALGDAIYRMANDKNLRASLVEKGEEQLKKFDTFEERASKILKLTEAVAGKSGASAIGNTTPIVEKSPDVLPPPITLCKSIGYKCGSRFYASAERRAA